MKILARYYTEFFERNLLERIVIYLCLSSALVKLIFELILGQWGFVQSQNKQWVFYILLLLDYALGHRKLLNVNFTLNLQSIFALLLFIMIGHGLLVGVYMHNQPFVIFNDTVPLLMIALNILRMQSTAEGTEPVDCYRLLKDVVVLLGFASLCSLAAYVLGRPAQLALDQSTIFYPLFFAVLCTRKNIPLWIFGGAAVLAAMSLTDMNRTSLLFIVLAFSVYMFLQTIKSPVRMLGLVALGFVVLGIGIMFVPQDSKTYQRITGIEHINTGERTGSVGERWAERDAVQAKLDRLGQEAQWFGLGFGGLYEVSRTHEYLTNYGHAHFSWVWFNLRFGMVGQLYLFLMVALFFYNVYCGLWRAGTLGFFIAFINILCILYCLTYVNAVFLLSGIGFFSITPRTLQKKTL